MKNKLLKVLTPLVSLATVASVVSCGSNKDESNLVSTYKHMYLTDKDVQDSKTRKHIAFNDLQRDEIDEVPTSLNGLYDSKILSGGWGEERHFYATGQTHIHTGVDVFLPQGTNVYAPANGQILASYWVKTGDHEFGQGIGGTIIMRVKIEDLDIDSELKEFVYVDVHHKIHKLPKVVFAKDNKYVEPDNISTKAAYDTYFNGLSATKKASTTEAESHIMIGIIHLSENSPIKGDVITSTYTSHDHDFTIKMNSTIDNAHPLEVTKGTLIGRVGTMADNGGWVPHMHVNAYSALTSLFSRATRYDFKDQKTPAQVKKIWAQLKPNGVFVERSHVDKPIEMLMGRGLFDPNSLFNFYNSSDKTVEFTV